MVGGQGLSLRIRHAVPEMRQYSTPNSGETAGSPVVPPTTYYYILNRTPENESFCLQVYSNFL